MCSALTKNFVETTTGCSFFMPDYFFSRVLAIFSVSRHCYGDLLNIIRSAAESLVAPLDSAVHSHDFEQINVF